MALFIWLRIMNSSLRSVENLLCYWVWISLRSVGNLLFYWVWISLRSVGNLLFYWVWISLRSVGNLLFYWVEQSRTNVKDWILHISERYLKLIYCLNGKICIFCYIILKCHFLHSSNSDVLIIPIFH